MLASTYTQYGPPEVIRIENLPIPKPKDDEILVRVHATTVNRTDDHMLRGRPFIMQLLTGLGRPRNSITGTDFAGRIEVVGRNVKSYSPGDDVFGFDDQGLSSHAQYLTISERKAFQIMPAGISYVQAAASLEGVHYAINFINKVRINPGDEVLVNGASGAIGSAMVQLLKPLGAKITGVCGTKNIDLVKSLGADHVIDYSKEDFTRAKHQYDYVFDTVGKSSFGHCKRILKEGGTYISSELGWMAQNLFFALVSAIFGRMPWNTGKKVKFPYPPDIRKSLTLIKERIEKGEFKAVIDKKYPLKEIALAYEYVETGQKTGNVVIIM